MRELERRNITATVEWRAAAEGKSGPGVLFGYAAKYNTLSQNLGGFVETISPGAFDKSIGDNVRMMCRYNHKDSHLLGTTEAQTLRLSLDDIGLMYEVDLPDTSSGRDVAALAARGDVRYSSFAFYCIEDDWGMTDDMFPMRTLEQCQLVDVAPVNSPAYLDTSVAKRSLSERINVPVDDLAGKPVEEIRSLILNEKTSAGESAGDGETEQRETHSTPPTVELLRLELNESR